MSRRRILIAWISLGSALALSAAASLAGGILLQGAGNSVGESLVVLARVLAAFSVGSFVVLTVALQRRRAPATPGAAAVERPTAPRSVSKLSRYIRGVFQGFGAFALAIIGLLMLTRGNKAGIVVIVIAVAFAVAALTNFWLAERTSRADAGARRAVNSKG